MVIEPGPRIDLVPEDGADLREVADPFNLQAARIRKCLRRMFVESQEDAGHRGGVGGAG